MIRILVFATLALIAAACSSAPNVTTVDSGARSGLPITPNPNGKTMDVTGLLEVTVTGIGANSDKATATAVFHGTDQSGNLSAKGIAVVAGNVTFTQKFVSSFDLTTGAITKRFVQTGFDILNSSTFNYINMTMVATSLVAATTTSGVITTVGGTAISNMINNTGGGITNVAVARSFIPSHGFVPGFTVAPNPVLADLQYLTTAEAATVKATGQSSGRISAGNVNKVLPLEYGYSGRNVTGVNRVISSPTGTAGTLCTVPATCNKGVVTFAHSFVLDPSVTNQPYSYKTWYIVANEYAKTYSKALEGDAINNVPTVAGLLLTNTEMLNNRTRVLENGIAGKAIAPATGTDLLQNVCQVQMANAAGADPVLKYPSSLQTGVGLLNGCFGEAGKRLKAPPVANAAFGVRTARVAATVDGGKVVFSQQRQFSTLDPCGNSNNEDWRVDFFRPDGNVYAAHLILGASICRLIDAEGDSTAANVAYLLSQNASNSIYVDRVDSAGTDTFFGLPSGVDWKRIVMHNAAIGSNAKPLYVLGQSGTTGFRVLRLNGTDLTVDTTFGTAGLFSLDFPGETVSVIDMAVSSAGLYILNKRSIGIFVSTTVLKLLHTGAADTTYGFDSFSSDVEGSVFSEATLYPTSIALDSGNQAFIAGSTCPTCVGTPADMLFVAKYTGGGKHYGGFGINGAGYAEYTSCQNAGTQTNVSGSVQITTRSNGDAILFANGAANSMPGSGADFCAINLNNVGAETARRTHDMYGQNDQFLDLDTSANAAGSVSIAGLSTSSVNRYFVADVNR